LTQRDYRGKCHSREEEILNCSCIALNADYEEKGSKEESLTLAATWNSAQPAACPASDLQVLGLPPSRATSCLAPQLREGGGGGNLQQRILLQLRVPKTSRTWGKKCRKSEEQSVACQILLTERQGQSVLLLETKQ